MADKSPGKSPTPSGGSGDDDRGRTEKRPRSLLNKVSFFEQVWWGRARSPSIERAGAGRREGTVSPDVEIGTEVVVEDVADEGPGHEKRPRRASGSPERLSRRRRSSEEEWEWVEDESSSSTLAEDIERRLEERRRMRSSSISPTREWVQLRRGSEELKGAERREPTPEPWESTYSVKGSSMAEEIERRLEVHRQEVRQRLSSPVKEWPQLRQSPGPRSSRGATPEPEEAAEGEARRSPARQLVSREVVAKAERSGGVAKAVTSTTHTTTVWGAPGDARPHTETQSSSDRLEEDDPDSAGLEGFQRVEEEERESVEHGDRVRYKRVVVRRSVERSVTTSPSPEPMEQEGAVSPRLLSPSPPPGEAGATPPHAHKTRSRTKSGPRSRLRSRTPSVERILEVEEAEDSPVVSLSSSTDPRILDEPDEERQAASSASKSSASLDQSPGKSPDEQASSRSGPDAASSGKGSRSPDDRLTMEAVSSVQWEEGGTRNEVRRYSTRVLIRDRDPSYTKYVMTSRTASRDSLFSTASSSEESPRWEGAPAWVAKVTPQPAEEDAQEGDKGTLRQRSKQYQQHISSLKEITQFSGQSESACQDTLVDRVAD
ncbi:serine/arginine repetitive matrix protein 1-like [Penaeus japonicus]|uniref:serine/arginine repetitive matrix protein 1-like n=1 Tax=Penaeus japonicus TaxID=27405 RepID=UPI001C715303|nr:serine/arginine repetitive matrix protein 1-like [Penaeus japonicus]